jgi:hypothetical protein
MLPPGHLIQGGAELWRDGAELWRGRAPSKLDQFRRGSRGHQWLDNISQQSRSRRYWWGLKFGGLSLPFTTRPKARWFCVVSFGLPVHVTPHKTLTLRSGLETSAGCGVGDAHADALEITRVSKP